MNAASSSPPAGTVTFLFTDAEGSTKLLAELGPAYTDELEDQRRWPTPGEAKTAITASA